MKSVYVDGKLRIEVKSKYAYAYNKAGSQIGVWQFDNRKEFIDGLFKAGFKRDEEDYQESLRKSK